MEKGTAGGCIYSVGLFAGLAKCRVFPLFGLFVFVGDLESVKK